MSDSQQTFGNSPVYCHFHTLLEIVKWVSFALVTAHSSGNLMKNMHFTCSLLLTITLIGLTAASVSAADKLYRWIDDSGNQVNSDRPPPAVRDYEVISIESSMVRTPGEERDSPGQVEGGNEEAYEEAYEEDTEPRIQARDSDSDSDSKKNPEYCEIARNNLTQLSGFAKIRLTGDDGEIRYLDEEEKEIQRENATRAVAAYCP